MIARHGADAKMRRSRIIDSNRDGKFDGTSSIRRAPLESERPPDTVTQLRESTCQVSLGARRQSRVPQITIPETYVQPKPKQAMIPMLSVEFSGLRRGARHLDDTQYRTLRRNLPASAGTIKTKLQRCKYLFNRHFFGDNASRCKGHVSTNGSG